MTTSAERAERRGAERQRRSQQGARRPGPQTVPAAKPVDRPKRAKTATQARARARARKAKAPRVVRPKLRERIRARLLERLEGLDLRPQVLLARVPFVVLIIGALGVGLGVTLWLSTDAAQRSYQLGNARALNAALTQQKEALERDVLQSESAPALAEAARELGMIPSRGTAHLVQDPVGNWVVVGTPRPAEGAPPPPLNTRLPDPVPPAPRPPAGEVPVRVGPPAGAAGAEVPVRLPPAQFPPPVPVPVPVAQPGPEIVAPAPGTAP
jgi:hypothetical protein